MYTIESYFFFTYLYSKLVIPEKIQDNIGNIGNILHFILFKKELILFLILKNINKNIKIKESSCSIIYF